MHQIVALYRFIVDVLRNQKLIFELAKKDFKTRFLGSYLGILWAFVQPTISILIFWFVFQVGFKNTPVDNFPFILWLAAAIIPWNFFAESLQGATHSIIENSYLVKKVVFRISILPIVKIYSALFVHLFFIVFLIVMYLLYGYMPTIYYLQIIYYLFAVMMLLLGLSWVTSTLVIFLKDTGQIVAMLVQFGFWLTPIFYSLKIVPEKYHFFIKINPMYHIIEGYRNTFIYHKWFWESPYVLINFWIFTFFFLALGSLMFKKLRPHFADVL
ncbi:teichoic acid transport system permease protein [Paenibacillus tianmuensis]|uniref:Transport permease protein n=1 Tax=Paenibacillus tianmuensis TaxID=624147 RepID=A0A1G4TVL4_9BACL|nr:ABC transporter permease [Paenibacillus tianmuensis]SCW85368.1 teichoic acid transport system permease protein [Paenibacillus tianmuensis]